VERDLAAVLQRAEDWDGEPGGVRPSDYLRAWYHGDALDQLLRYRAALVSSSECANLGRVVLSRAARSARLTTHFELDFPRRPQTGPYQCRKHSRVCAPTSDAAKFLRRYTLDTARRVREYAALRADVRADVIHGDARTVDYAVGLDGVITSPPYPGRIDYHEQHRYAFELLGLDERRAEEIGAPWRGTGRAAIDAYVDDMTAVFANARRFLAPGAAVVLVVDDSRDLFGCILVRAGLRAPGGRVLRTGHPGPGLRTRASCVRAFGACAGAAAACGAPVGACARGGAPAAAGSCPGVASAGARSSPARACAAAPARASAWRPRSARTRPGTRPGRRAM
jgi:hypothetical protein